MDASARLAAIALEQTGRSVVAARTRADRHDIVLVWPILFVSRVVLPPSRPGTNTLRRKAQQWFASLWITTLCSFAPLVSGIEVKGFGKGLGSGAPEAGYAWYAGI